MSVTFIASYPAELPIPAPSYSFKMRYFALNFDGRNFVFRGISREGVYNSLVELGSLNIGDCTAADLQEVK